MYTRPDQRGFSMIELIMFIVIVAVALAGIALAMNMVNRGSTDPLIHKQALAIAESLLEEVELMPFTFCDPDDANAASAVVAAVSPTGCAATVEAIGPEAGETRYSVVTPFDNVSDYNGCQMNTGTANAGCDATGAGGISDITGAATGPATGYTAAVVVAEAGIPAIGASPAIAATESLLITVTVTGPDGKSVVVDGIRTRYSPRTLP